MHGWLSIEKTRISSAVWRQGMWAERL